MDLIEEAGSPTMTATTVNKSDTKLVQILNVSPSTTIEQMTALFSLLGDIINIELYNSYDNDTNDEISQQQQNNNTNIFKVCFVEYAKSSSVIMAQHLTNTVFVDRALTILPYNNFTNIPDRNTALEELIGCKSITNFNLGVTNQVMNSVGGAQVITTIDPKLSALGLPQYPHLPVNTDPNRIEEIRRTVYIGNLDSTIPPDQVMKFFNDIGEVKYIRMAGDDTQPTRFAFVEFTHQASVANALQHNGFTLGSKALKINHSNNAIVKPQIKLIEQQTSIQPEPETTIKRVHNDKDLANARDHESRDDRRRHHSSSSSRYDRDRSRDRGRDRRDDRRLSPKDSRTSSRRRSRSRDTSRRRRSKSREGESSSRIRRSRSKDNIKRRSRSRESSSRNKTSSRRSRSRSSERSRSSRHYHHKGSRR